MENENLHDVAQGVENSPIDVSSNVLSHEVYNKVDDEISLLERIIIVENQLEKEKKSRVKKVSLWGGIVALFISILIGSYNLYDISYLSINREIEQSVARVVDISGEIVEINTKLTEIMLSGNPEQIRAVSMVYNTRKLALLRQADRFLENERVLVSFSDYIIFASEHLTFGNAGIASSYANQAVAAAGDEGSKAEALRYLARATASMQESDSVQSARGIFEEALSVVENTPVTTKPYITINIYMDWAITEAYYGDCDLAIEKIGMLRTILGARAIPDEQVAGVEQQLIRFNEQMLNCNFLVQ